MTKEDAIKTIRELKRETNDNWYEEVYDMAIEALQAHPTLDDVSTAYENGYKQGKFEALQSQQKTGKWIPWKAYYGEDRKSWSDELKCSECGYKWGDEEYKFCPSCGCRMEREEE